MRSGNNEEMFAELGEMLARDDQEAYASFLDNFGNALKEGPAEDASEY